ncbi:MAG: hypothetical protein AAFO07_24720, partial [Bacteroidota bacterium]
NYQKNDNTFHFEELVRLTKKLETTNESKIGFSHKYYENDDHASLCVAATYDGLRFVFDWYHLDVLGFKLQAKESEEVRRILKSYQALLSKKFKQDFPLDEKLMRKIALACMRQDESLTEDLLKQNLQNYPNSFSANFSLASFYRLQGKPDSGILYIEKALEIKEEESARAFLIDLKKEQQ